MIQGFALAGLLCGCGRDAIQVNTVSKETNKPAAPPSMVPGHGHGAQSSWKLKAKMPEGWIEQAPDSMRVGRYVVPSKDGLQADVSAIPLPGISVSKEDLVNMWLKQLHLPGATASELEKLVAPVAIGADKGDLYEMVSSELLLDNKYKARILVATLPQTNTTWFFKMMGPDDLVKASKAAFVEYLKSVQIEAGEPTASPAVGMLPTTDAHSMLPPTTDAHSMPGGATMPSAMPLMSGMEQGTVEKPKWETPKGWKEQPATPMVLAKFTASSDAGPAAITVSQLSGDGGGLLPNINRWRGQLQLSDVNASEMAKLVTPLKLAQGEATLADMTGTDPRTGGKARMVTVIVSQENQTWFYKLTGPEAAVAAQKAAFTQFVQSAKH